MKLINESTSIITLQDRWGRLISVPPGTVSEVFDITPQRFKNLITYLNSSEVKFYPTNLVDKYLLTDYSQFYETVDPTPGDSTKITWESQEFVIGPENDIISGYAKAILTNDKFRPIDYSRFTFSGLPEGTSMEITLEDDYTAVFNLTGTTEVKVPGSLTISILDDAFLTHRRPSNYSDCTVNYIKQFPVAQLDWNNVPFYGNEYGSIVGGQIMALITGKFKTPLTSDDYSIVGVPAGVNYEVTNDESSLEVKLSGRASVLDDTQVVFTLNESALVDCTLPENHSVTVALTFANNLTWSYEPFVIDPNTGSVKEGSITASLTSDTFVGSISPEMYEITGIPEGLNAVVVRKSASSLQVTLEGTATARADGTVTFDLKETAFTSGELPANYVEASTSISTELPVANLKFNATPIEGEADGTVPAESSLLTATVE